MVSDSEIKTKISPFSIRPGEIKVFDGKDGYVSMNQITSKINQGVITDIHFKILDYINKYEFLTSRQMFQLLEMDKVEIKNQDKLNKKLEQLVKTKILTRYFFKSHEGEGVYRIYCMEKMGKYLLKSREIDCKWQPTDNTKPVEMIKKKLSGNQLVINYLRKVPAVESIKLKPEITDKRLDKVFKPIARITLSYANQQIDFVFEVVRREEGWEENLVKRMEQWKNFYESYQPGDSGFLRIPQLIFVCEDTKHMAETFKCLYMNKMPNFGKIKFYYTTDLAQNEEKLNKSFYEFVEEAGKFKIKNLDAKLLA
jgi:hypothetical protein